MQYRPTPGLATTDVTVTINRLVEYQDVNDNGVFDENTDTIVQSINLDEQTPEEVTAQNVSTIPEAKRTPTANETPGETPVNETAEITPVGTATTATPETTEQAQAEETPMENVTPTEPRCPRRLQWRRQWRACRVR